MKRSINKEEEIGILKCRIESRVDIINGKVKG